MKHENKIVIATAIVFLATAIFSIWSSEKYDNDMVYRFCGAIGFFVGFYKSFRYKNSLKVVVSSFFSTLLAILFAEILFSIFALTVLTDHILIQKSIAVAIICGIALSYVYKIEKEKIKNKKTVKF